MFISKWTLKLKNQNSGHFQHHQRVKICVSRGQERRLLAIRWFPVLERPSARYWTRVACDEQATWIGDYSCQSVLLQWVCRLRFLTIRICIGCFILKVLDFLATSICSVAAWESAVGRMPPSKIHQPLGCFCNLLHCLGWKHNHCQRQSQKTSQQCPAESSINRVARSETGYIDNIINCNIVILCICAQPQISKVEGNITEAVHKSFKLLSFFFLSDQCEHSWLIPSPYCPPLQLASWEIYSCTVLSKTSCFRNVVLLLLTHKNDTEAVLTSAEYNSIRAPICCRVPLQLHSVV